MNFAPLEKIHDLHPNPRRSCAQSAPTNEGVLREPLRRKKRLRACRCEGRRGPVRSARTNEGVVREPLRRKKGLRERRCEGRMSCAQSAPKNEGGLREPPRSCAKAAATKKRVARSLLRQDAPRWSQIAEGGRWASSGANSGSACKLQQQLQQQQQQQRRCSHYHASLPPHRPPRHSHPPPLFIPLRLFLLLLLPRLLQFLPLFLLILLLLLLLLLLFVASLDLLLPSDSLSGPQLPSLPSPGLSVSLALTIMTSHPHPNHGLASPSSS